MTMRWTEADYARYLLGRQPAPVSEKVWQSTCLRLLTQHGCMTYHTFDSRRSPAGFPDIVAVHETPGRALLAIECKTDTGQVTPAQAAWLEALAGTSGVVAEVWRPKDLETICARLRD